MVFLSMPKKKGKLTAAIVFTVSAFVGFLLDESPIRRFFSLPLDMRNYPGAYVY